MNIRAKLINKLNLYLAQMDFIKYDLPHNKHNTNKFYKICLLALLLEKRIKTMYQHSK